MSDSLLESETPGTSKASPGVRRNLFQNQLGRRGTSTTSLGSLSTAKSSIHDENDDLVSRNADGDFRLNMPQLPEIDDYLVTTEESTNLSQREDKQQHFRDTLVTENEQRLESENTITALHAALKRRVLMLADDAWMFDSTEPRVEHE